MYYYKAVYVSTFTQLFMRIRGATQNFQEFAHNNMNTYFKS